MTEPLDTGPMVDLEPIEQRLAAATPGPWYVYDRGFGFHIAVEPDRPDRPPELIPEGHKTDIGRRADAEFIAHARTDVQALVTEVERLHTWDGLMSLLDQHWPDDLIPTLPDHHDRDPGPRIVSLLRWVDRLRDKVRHLERELQETIRGGES